MYTYFFWPHSNAAEKIVTKFNKGKVRARAESLHVWELGGGSIGLYWQRFRKCWGIIYPRGRWQATKKQNKKQNKPWLHKGMETTPHKVSQRTFHHNMNISPTLSSFPKMRQPQHWHLEVHLKYWSCRCLMLGCSCKVVQRCCSADALNGRGEVLWSQVTGKGRGARSDSVAHRQQLLWQRSSPAAPEWGYSRSSEYSQV